MIFKLIDKMQMPCSWVSFLEDSALKKMTKELAVLGNTAPRELPFTGASMDVWAPGMDVALLDLSSACCGPFLCLTYN